MYLAHDDPLSAEDVEGVGVVPVHCGDRNGGAGAQIGEGGNLGLCLELGHVHRPPCDAEHDGLGDAASDMSCVKVEQKGLQQNVNHRYTCHTHTHTHTCVLSCATCLVECACAEERDTVDADAEFLLDDVFDGAAVDGEGLVAVGAQLSCDVELFEVVLGGDVASRRAGGWIGRGGGGGGGGDGGDEGRTRYGGKGDSAHWAWSRG